MLKLNGCSLVGRQPHNLILCTEGRCTEASSYVISRTLCDVFLCYFAEFKSPKKI